MNYNRMNFADKGYREYKPTAFHNSNVSRCWQKRFDDEHGKKYFIDINEWDNAYLKSHLTYSDGVPDFAYEFSMQMYAAGTHNPINILFHSSWTLAEVEEFVEKMWQTGMYDYYEKWED